MNRSAATRNEYVAEGQISELERKSYGYGNGSEQFVDGVSDAAPTRG